LETEQYLRYQKDKDGGGALGGGFPTSKAGGMGKSRMHLRIREKEEEWVYEGSCIVWG